MYELKDISCYIFDMDGTIYLGNRVIPGAYELLNLMNEKNIPFYFFTNNSSRSPLDYIEKLERLGFGAYTRERIITSADVAIDYIFKTFGTAPSAYVVGTPSLVSQLSSAGIRCLEPGKPDCVLVGFDTTYNFEKAKHAVDLLRLGVPFLATNIDAVCPLEDNMVLPDCASICAMLTHATGCVPKYLGKPFFETAAYIQHHTGFSAQKTAVVGDRLYTDMQLAIKNGMCAIGVLSGEMTQSDIDLSPDKPDFIFLSVKSLFDILK